MNHRREKENAKGGKADNLVQKAGLEKKNTERRDEKREMHTFGTKVSRYVERRENVLHP